MAQGLLLAAVGLFLTGYLILDGSAFGVGAVRLRTGGGETERRLSLNAVGPYFLGHEVWVVAAVGLLIGAFPELEAAVFTGYFPVFVVLVGAFVLRDGGMWLRSRRESAGSRRFWDRAIAVASVVLALSWGLVLGNLAEGVPSGGHPAAAFSPYALLCALAFGCLVVLHGAAFLAMRVRGEQSVRAAALARRLVLPAAGLLVLVLAFGFLAADVAAPVVAAVLVALAVVALAVAARFLGRGVHGPAFAATACAVGLPVLAVGAGQSPVLVGLAAAPESLAVLGVFLACALPVMLLGQVWLWRAFAGPVVPAAPLYF